MLLFEAVILELDEEVILPKHLGVHSRDVLRLVIFALHQSLTYFGTQTS